MYKTREFQYRVTGPDINPASRALAEQLSPSIVSDANEFKHYKSPPPRIGAAREAN
jgi:hypothetical protein